MLLTMNSETQIKCTSKDRGTLHGGNACLYDTSWRDDHEAQQVSAFLEASRECPLLLLISHLFRAKNVPCAGHCAQQWQKGAWRKHSLFCSAQDLGQGPAICPDYLFTSQQLFNHWIGAKEYSVVCKNGMNFRVQPLGKALVEHSLDHTFLYHPWLLVYYSIPKVSHGCKAWLATV